MENLSLLPHPEGGYYKETYRSLERISKLHLPDSFSGDRNYCTAIYFLLTSDNFSAFHRIKQDEIWHFYEGDILNVHVISPEGNYIKHRVGPVSKGLHPQLLVPKGYWFASNIENIEGYCLVGCTVAPGFDFKDFELAKRINLRNKFPEHAAIINQLTRS